jgi:hypothetical protein
LALTSRPQLYHDSMYVIVGGYSSIPWVSDLGPVLFPALHQRADTDPDQPWTGWLTSLNPTPLTTDHLCQHPLKGTIDAVLAPTPSR